MPPTMPRDRYRTDAQFHALVDAMRAQIESAQFTPTEIREAAMLAQIMYEERLPQPGTRPGEFRTRDGG